MIDKNEAKRQFKQTGRPRGIYQIKNLVNGKIFIESSPNLDSTLNSNMFRLKQNRHLNQALQKDFTEQGEKSFSFEIVDTLEPKEDPAYDYTNDLKVLEEMWLDRLQPYDEKGYNRRKAGQLPRQSR